MKILFIGDVVGRPGREILAAKLKNLIRAWQADMVIVNGENAAGGKGITPEVAKELYDLGVDVITMGNHTWDNRGIFQCIDSDPNLIRPANFPQGTPGRGYTLYEVRPGKKPVAVINLMGRVYMQPLDCPFACADQILKELAGVTPLIFVDFHAEVTSEKIAMGWYLDGRVTAVAGTHTHVQTADERVLPKGTAFITDTGMTGPRDSVLGVDPQIIIRKFTTQMPVRHELAGGQKILSGILVEAEENLGRASKIIRICEYMD
ncbi:MAG: TIGR00282 family metallophosphoesterase [Peptococcaceae bacterium]|nr:TIGR00282 family metallophosphoesterase [Peptococcaceae bacterium]